MDFNILINRAEEHIENIKIEYEDCLTKQNISDKARLLTHETLSHLRSALDYVMNTFWEKAISPNLSEAERKTARIYFPICKDTGTFQSTLGRGKMADLETSHPKMHAFLLQKQPFSSTDNNWLNILAKISAEGKHTKLTPQVRNEQLRISVTRKESGGGVSWDPSAVRYDNGVSIMVAPVNPKTQRIVPTPGVVERKEIWVSFILEGYGVDALLYCKEALSKTKALLAEMATLM